MKGGQIFCGTINVIIFITFCVFIVSYVEVQDYKEDQCYITEFNNSIVREVICKTNSRMLNIGNVNRVNIQGYSVKSDNKKSILFNYDVLDGNTKSQNHDYTVEYNSCRNSRKLNDKINLINIVKQGFKTNTSVPCWVYKTDINEIYIHNSFNFVLFYIICASLGLFTIFNIWFNYKIYQENHKSSSNSNNNQNKETLVNNKYSNPV